MVDNGAMACVRPFMRGAATLVGVASLALGAVACGSGDSGSGAKATASAPTTAAAGAIHGIHRDPPLNVGDQVLPDVTTDDAAPFAFKAPAGKLLVVYFGYTNCPDLCPTTMSEVKLARKALGAQGANIQVAMVTVDPVRDTPPALRTFLAQYFDDAKSLRTEDTKLLAAVEKAFLVRSMVMDAPDGSYQVQHTADTYVVDPTGEVVAEWTFGTRHQDMAADLGTLLTNVGSAAASELEVTGAWIRPTTAENGAAYATITSPVDDVLTGASVASTVAAGVEIHQTTASSMTGDSMGSSDTAPMMSMAPVDSVALPAGQPVAFAPGGYHLMLTKLVGPLTAGSAVDLTMHFKVAGDRTVSFSVKDDMT